jgi:hypothetical protein
MPDMRTKTEANPTVATAELAKTLGLTVERIRQLTVAGVLKKLGRNSFDLPSNVRAFVEHKAAEARAKVPDSQSDAARLLRAKADAEEQRAIAARLDVAVRSGRLVDWRALLAFISGHRRSLMRRLRLIPTKLAARLASIDDPAAIERLLLAEIDSVLEELAGEDGTVADYVTNEVEAYVLDEAKDHSADHGNGQRRRRSGGAETETGNPARRGKAGTGTRFE